MSPALSRVHTSIDGWYGRTSSSFFWWHYLGLKRVNAAVLDPLPMYDATRQIARRALQELSGCPALKDTPPVANTPDVDEEDKEMSSPGVTEGSDSLEAFESAALLSATVAPTLYGKEVDAMSERSQPLLSGEASRNFSSS